MKNLQTLKLEYEDYLRNQRGLSEKSIYDCWRFADRFLNFRFKGRSPDLSKITPADIARFMLHLVSRGNRFVTRRRRRTCETSFGSSSRAERQTSISLQAFRASRRNMRQRFRGTYRRHR